MTRFLLLPCLLALAPPVVSAQEFVHQIVALGGDAYGGGQIATIEAVAVDDTGRWMVHARLAGVPVGVDEVLIRDGVVVAQESDLVATPSGGAISQFRAFALAAGDREAHLYRLKDTGGAPLDDHAVLVDDVLVVQEGDLTLLPGFSVGTTYGNLFDLEVNVQGEVLLNAAVDDPGIPGNSDRALVRVNTGVGQGAVLAKTGDVLPGVPGRALVSFGIQPEDTAMNDGGDIVFVGFLDGDQASDQVVCLVDDQGLALLAQEGDPAPGGGVYQLFSQSGVGVNVHGGYVFQATRQDGSSLLVTHEGLFIAEGDPLPGKPGFDLFDLGTFAPAEIDDRGRVLWIGRWSGVSGTSGLFLDHALAVEENVTVVDGRTVTALDMGSNAYHVSPNGEWIIVSAVTTPGGQPTAILVNVLDVWEDLGGGTTGVAGSPELTLSGPLTPGSAFGLQLVSAAPSALALLFVSVGSTPTAFLGGTLHAFPFAQLVLVATDPAGELSAGVVFPGAPSGATLVFQVAIEDASVPVFGGSLSNGVRGTVP